MSYIGNPIYQVAFVTDSFSGTGSTTVFSMSVAPANTASVLVIVSGVVQDPSTYSVAGTTLTFSAAPPSGTSNISVRYLGIPASGVTTTAYRTKTEFTATAGQTTFTPPSYNVGFINVYSNGVLLGSADYTATNGTTVVLTTGVAAGTLVTVESFRIESVANAIPNAAGAINLAGTLVSGTLPVANGGTGATTSTGSGANVLSASPTFTGQLTIPTINLTGGQITFPATQSASSDASTLDDYEEGTWTPKNSSGSALSCNGTPRYIKIGKQVFIHCDINQLSQGAVYNLPFTAVANSAYPGTICVGYNSYTSSTVTGIVNNNDTKFELYYNGGSSITPTNARLICAGVYEAIA